MLLKAYTKRQSRTEVNSTKVSVQFSSVAPKSLQSERTELNWTEISVQFSCVARTAQSKQLNWQFSSVHLCSFRPLCKRLELTDACAESLESVIRSRYRCSTRKRFLEDLKTISSVVSRYLPPASSDIWMAAVSYYTTFHTTHRIKNLRTIGLMDIWSLFNVGSLVFVWYFTRTSRVLLF